MKTTDQGSCHRDAVAFEGDIDLAEGTGCCHCSICTETRAWGGMVRPDAFRPVRGEEALSDDPFGTRSMHPLFCRPCGVPPFGRGHQDVLGGDFLSINPACLDDVEPQALIAAPLRYNNGRDNDWQPPPAEPRHL